MAVYVEPVDAISQYFLPVQEEKSGWTYQGPEGEESVAPGDLERAQARFGFLPMWFGVFGPFIF